MKRAFAALAFSALLAAPAFAQGSLDQPDTPDNGVGVDYTQPYLNDLLLRMQPLVDGNMIGQGLRLSCEKERNALAENPLDKALDQAYDMCVARRQKQLDELSRQLRDMPPPSVNPPLFRPERNPPRMLRPLPPMPSHPNAQN